MTTSVDVLAMRLREALGERATTDPDRMGTYIRDQSLLTEAGVPAALVKATSAVDVVATMKIAHELSVPVVTRGAGTGLAGAANAIDGCIILGVAGMNRILSIDAAARTATVEPGVINGDLADAARAQGLWYVPDPGSRAISTIGGNLATNAGGICCAKYGVTGDHVAELTAVLADGRVIRTGAKTRKNVAGLDLTHLLVGSEGTLAVIVEATMRLRTAPYCGNYCRGILRLGRTGDRCSAGSGFGCRAMSDGADGRRHHRGCKPVHENGSRRKRRGNAPHSM